MNERGRQTDRQNGNIDRNEEKAMLK